MRLNITFLLALLFLSACSSNHKNETQSEVEISKAMQRQEAEKLVAGMFASIDGKNWDEFENSFANRTVVVLDEPQILKPKQVTARLKPMFEYFDSTKHEILNFELEEKNERLLGTSKMSGTYWKKKGLTSDVATTTGKYEFEFTREGEQLKIMRMRYFDQKVSGDKEIMKSAMEKNDLELPYKVSVVDFPSENGKSMRGWLFIPNGTVHDVVIINGNIANIKEQGSYEYARLLARQGISALVFDFINFGESEGSVRNLEDPGQKINDFRGAVDFVSLRKEFSGARISLAGLGASAGYVSEEAVNDPRVDRVIMISPWLLNPDIVQANEVRFQDKLRMAREANHQFQQDGVLTYVPVASFNDQNAVLTAERSAELDYYTNPGRGNIPQWTNRFATIGWNHWLNFDSTSSASRIRVPTLIIHNESGPHAAGVQQFVSRMRTKAEVHSISASPYDFYDRNETMRLVVEIIEDFLNPVSSDSGVTKL